MFPSLIRDIYVYVLNASGFNDQLYIFIRIHIFNVGAHVETVL